ncbi:WD40 repeat domain-containing protein [Marinimicrobium locisalis]|uniref:WD40 repeat domain-containing protein n=1 Tax=Marinimicrobium locisalis TaxID=546022 RepID=UPI0032216B5C
MGHSYTLVPRALRLPPSLAALVFTLGALSGCDRGAEPSASLEVAARSVQTGALSWDGEWAVVGSGYQGGSLWRLDSRERLYGWNHKADTYTLLTTASFSPQNDYALTTDERTLVLWSRETGQAQQYWSSPAEILASQLGPAGERALLGLADHRASLYNVRRGGIVRNLAHSDRVGAVALSEDGERALTGSDAGTATLWNARTGEPLAHQQHESPIELVAMAPGGDLLLSSGRYERAKLWQPNGDMVWELPLDEEHVRRGAQITSARFSDEGTWLLTGQPTGRIDLWDLEERRLAFSWRLPKRKAFHPVSVSVVDLAFTDNPDLYRALSSDGFVHELTY